MWGRAEPGDGVEHGGPDVTLTVGTVADGFSVEDDGPGIPAGGRGTLLAASSSEGTGLGLPIVRAIVTAHGWELSITTGQTGIHFTVCGVEFVDEAWDPKREGGSGRRVDEPTRRWEG